LTFLAKYSINSEMAGGLDLPPFLINNIIYKGYDAMTESTVSQKKAKRHPHNWINTEHLPKYGKLKIIGDEDTHILPSGQKRRRVKCLCDCGNTAIVFLDNLRGGKSKSCGCVNRKHGLSKHPIYDVWNNMIRRCSDVNGKDSADYCKRGISVCNEWLDIKTFSNWAQKNGWKQGLYLDRIDVDGDYTANNVRFVDAGWNTRNKRPLSKTNTSGYVGAHYHKRQKSWASSIRCNGALYHLGYFNTAIEAAKARDAKARELNMGHPLNFNPQEGETTDEKVNS